MSRQSSLQLSHVEGLLLLKVSLLSKEVLDPARDALEVLQVEPDQVTVICRQHSRVERTPGHDRVTRSR